MLFGGEEVVHHLFDLPERGLEIVIDQDFVKLGSVCHLLRGLRHPVLDGFRRVGAPLDQPLAEDLHGGGLDEYRQGLVPEVFLQADATLDIHVEDDHMALGPDPVDLGLEGAVELVRIDFLIFDELVHLDELAENVGGVEKIFDAILFCAARGAGCCRDGELHFRMKGKDMVDDGALPGS